MAPTKTKTKTKRAKKPALLNVVLLWDMSGSMRLVHSSALEGANQYIEDLRKDKTAKNMRVSITVFDTVFERWHEDLSLSEIPVFGERYQPRGMTALNDAVADAIVSMEERLQGDRAEERVLIVVLTDGQENSSKEYGGPKGLQALASLIKRKEETGLWTFVYLGAGTPQAVQAVASTYNIPAGNTVSYAATPEGTEMSFNQVAHVTRGMSASAAGSTVTAMADVGLKSVVEQKEDEEE